MYRHIPIFSAAIILLSGCSNVEEQSSGHSFRTYQENGITVAETTGGPKYDRSLFELESDLILGIEEGEPSWQMFNRNPSLLVAPDGTMVVVDNAIFNIFIVSRTGELLHQLGGEGEGPGEFRNILDVFWAEPGGEFWLTDQFNNRISKYRIDGTFIGSVNYSELRTRYSNFYYLGQRTFMAHKRDRDTNDPDLRIMRYALMNDNLEITQDLFTLEGQRYYRTSNFSSSPVPWTANSWPKVTPNGNILMVEPNHPRMTIYSSSAEPLLRIQRDWNLVPVTNNDVQSYKQRILDGFPDAEFGSVRFPDFKPPFRWALVDTEDRIWLNMYEPLREEGTNDEPGEIIGYPYEIYSAEGIWLGSHINQRFITAIYSGYIYQMNPLESGAPRLERLRIIPLVPELGSDQSR